MKVKLIAYTPNPEKVVAMAAKLCYSTCNIEDLEKDIDKKDISKFLNMLVSIGHESPLEHVNFTFAIEGVSRVLLAQHSRHRLQSMSVQSQRYCNLDETFNYVVPKSILEDEFLLDKFKLEMDNQYKTYVDITEYLKNKYISSGFKNKDAEKKAIEDARYVLPNACETKMIITMNARELLHYFKLRCCSRSQLEIRELATEMMNLCKEVAPILFKNAGPSCVNGKCSEGKMSCGNPWGKID